MTETSYEKRVTRLKCLFFLVYWCVNSVFLNMTYWSKNPYWILNWYDNKIILCFYYFWAFSLLYWTGQLRETTESTSNCTHVHWYHSLKYVRSFSDQCIILKLTKRFILSRIRAFIQNGTKSYWDLFWDKFSSFVAILLKNQGMMLKWERELYVSVPSFITNVVARFIHKSSSCNLSITL